MSKHLLAKAISIAAHAFEDKFDKSGEPYILHCLYVMKKQTTDTRRIIAILHDVPEDTHIDFDHLAEMGFGSSILVPLRLLTHDPANQSYDNYIKALSYNDDARAVKLADLEHNTQITRLKGLTKKDFDRMEKYHKAYVYLSKV